MKGNSQPLGCARVIVTRRMSTGPNEALAEKRNGVPEFAIADDATGQTCLSLQRAHNGNKLTCCNGWAERMDLDPFVQRARSPQSANTLLQSSHRPRQIEVDQDTGAPEAQSLTQHVGRDKEPERHRARFEGFAGDVESSDNFVDGHSA
jgi:hypothetical protein